MQKTTVQSDMEVHLGFFEAYTDIRERLLNTVTQYKNALKHPRILITGHSLGGALATLFAIDAVEVLGFN